MQGLQSLLSCEPLNLEMIDLQQTRGDTEMITNILAKHGEW